MMTRKHFVQIAAELKQQNASRAVCESKADFLATKNPRFARSRFLSACGY